jgi:hypothetical protein
MDFKKWLQLNSIISWFINISRCRLGERIPLKEENGSLNTSGLTAVPDINVAYF